MARNVSVYSVYNAAGTYYFGSDRANPLDTNYPYANAMLGSIFAYGDDNTKLVNHAHYTQTEWYLQDTFKASRRLTFDYGAALLPRGRPELQGRQLWACSTPHRTIPARSVNCSTRPAPSR